MIRKIKHVIADHPRTLAFLVIYLIILSILFTLYQAQKKQYLQGNAQSPANCIVTDADIAIDAEEQQLFDLINTYRQQNNLTLLRFSPTLNQAAAWNSNDMAARNLQTHIDSLSRSPAVRIRECGYMGYLGENLAPAATAQEAFDMWKNSPDHKINLDDPNAILTGIAHKGNFWTFDIGSLEESNTTPSPSQNPTITTAVSPSPSVTISTSPSTGVTLTLSPSPIPSAVCLGVPCVSPSEPPISLTPSTEPSSVTPTEITNAPSNELNPSPSISESPSEKPKKGKMKGGISQLIQLILEFIMMLLGLLLGNR